ncbi:hypothetical protein [Microterricola pindariensis]|nr:hypothetical protein [Microterricola pindariensis]
MILDDATTGAEVVPVVRMILECAVTAAWLLVAEGSGGAMVMKGSEQRTTALKDIGKRGMDVQESLQEVSDKIDELVGAGVASTGWVFQQRCEALSGGAMIYTLYRVFSAESHAGLRVADLYCVTDDASPIGVAFAADLPDEDRTATLGIAASLLLGQTPRRFLRCWFDERACAAHGGKGLPFRFAERRSTHVRRRGAGRGILRLIEEHQSVGVLQRLVDASQYTLARVDVPLVKEIAVALRGVHPLNRGFGKRRIVPYADPHINVDTYRLGKSGHWLLL